MAALKRAYKPLKRSHSHHFDDVTDKVNVVPPQFKALEVNENKHLKRLNKIQSALRMERERELSLRTKQLNIEEEKKDTDKLKI